MFFLGWKVNVNFTKMNISKHKIILIINDVTISKHKSANDAENSIEIWVAVFLIYQSKIKF